MLRFVANRVDWRKNPSFSGPNARFWAELRGISALQSWTASRKHAIGAARVSCPDTSVLVYETDSCLKSQGSLRRFATLSDTERAEYGDQNKHSRDFKSSGEIGFVFSTDMYINKNKIPPIEFICCHSAAVKMRLSCKPRLAYLDLASAILSVIGLVTAFIIAIESASRGELFVFDTWNENTFVIPDPDKSFYNDLHVMKNALSTTCAAADDPDHYDLYFRGIGWGNNTDAYSMTSLSTKGDSYNPWYLLFLVLFISALFQTYRYVYAYDYSDIFRYRPESGPDFWRWVEYALTSPLQIVLISSAFNARDNNFMLMLAGLQFALVLFGYSLELAIQDIISMKTKPEKIDLDDAPPNTLAQSKIVFATYLIGTWILHYIIWSILFTKFALTSQTVSDCNLTMEKYETPPPILFILISQFTTFTAFGVVLSAQGLWVICVSESTLSPDHVKWLWLRVTWIYSWLSVTAKLFLEYGMVGTLASFSLF